MQPVLAVKEPSVYKIRSLLLLTIFSGYVNAQTLPPKVAIIIDDIGFQKADPLLIRLPYQLTFAVMPFTPQGKEMARLASQQQKEIMLHMPMEAVAQNHLLGKGALRKKMSKSQVQQALHQALADVPQAMGVNNHMGSLYTSLNAPMDWTMQVMAERKLYFIDSKTTSRSAVGAATEQHGVKSRSRDIFLDNDKSYQALDRQFNQLLKLAKQQGSAIAIGHPYPETYQYLRKNLNRLKAEGIELVPVSQLLALPAPLTLAKHNEVAAPVAEPAKVVHSDKVNTPDKVAISDQVVTSETVTGNTAYVASSTKRQLKLSPQAPSSAAGIAGSGSVSLVYPTTDETLKLPEETAVDVKIADPIPAEAFEWHPPYRINLPGFSQPTTETIKTDWRFLLNLPADQADVAPLSGLLLLR